MRGPTWDVVVILSGIRIVPPLLMAWVTRTAEEVPGGVRSLSSSPALPITDVEKSCHLFRPRSPALQNERVEHSYKYRTFTFTIPCCLHNILRGRHLGPYFIDGEIKTEKTEESRWPSQWEAEKWPESRFPALAWRPFFPNKGFSYLTNV